jgi:lipopolysaccharide transport system ATP-binding protein
MSDVAQQGRTVLFVSHNMSAILRLTQEAIVLDRGQVIMRGPTQEAVDFYMSSGFTNIGERIWVADEVPPSAHPFKPLALRIRDHHDQVVDVVRSVEPLTVEIEYAVEEPIQGLRVGLYLMSMRGEYVFTSFDTDEPEKYDQFGVRPVGHYVSRCQVPADLLNEGRYALGMNASAFRVRRFFQEEQALVFNVDGMGAPGKQWTESRVGLVRPRLKWDIEVVK